MRRRSGALLLPLLLAGCAADADDVRQHRLDLAAHAAVTVHRDLQETVDRLFGALGEAEGALEAGEDTPWGRFDALAGLQTRWRVHGLLWEGPGGERAWAGRPPDLPPLPPPLPWRRSFRTGQLVYHDGPYLRMLVVGPAAVRGGMLTGSVVLEELTPERHGRRPFATRWLEPLGVEHVELLSPTSSSPPRDGAEAFLVSGPEGTPLLRGIVVPSGERAVRDRLEGQRRGLVGGILLVVWVLLAAGALRAARRWLAPGAARWLVVGGVVLLARAALGALDLPGRFAFLGPGFSPSDFGVEDPLGWLASPADFALSAAAALLAGACFANAVRGLAAFRRGAVRILAVAAGVGLAAASAALWLTLVELAVAQGQTDFFAVPSLVPSLPAALMLSGLVATTAAAWVVTLAGLRLAVRGVGRPPELLWALTVAVAAVAGALLLAGGDALAWGAPLLPATSLLAFLPAKREERAGLSSRILLVAVLATAALFPLLWDRAAERRTQTLTAALDALLSGEAMGLSATMLDLESVRADAEIQAALRAARRGPVPEELAFAVWLRSFLAQPEARGRVSILDPQGRRLPGGDFTLTPLPQDRLPAPAPPAAGAGDLQVSTARSDGRSVRSVVGRVRLRDEGEGALGTVVFTVPDPVDLALLGMGPAAAGVAEGPASFAGGRSALEYAILRGGRVVASSDPAISRRPGEFGPEALARLGPEDPELRWRGDDYEGQALWSWDRGATVAVRRRTAGAADAVLALARLVVVGVGLAAVGALGVLAVGLRRLRPRLHHRILLSYFAISVIPLVVLGWASARDARARHDGYLAERLETDIGRARSDLEAFGPEIFDRASDVHLVKWASQRGHDVFLYRDGAVLASSRPGLVQAELLPSRLPADAYRATVLERREIVRREASFAGRPVWFGYAPVLDDEGRARATVGVPLLYEKDRIEERFAVTGSVLLAAYLLTLVLVLVGGIYAARRLARPIGLLATGTRRVAAGEFDVELAPAGTDELGELVRAFNTMTRNLEQATARAVRAEREMAWQRMARQVAHEIKNPLTPIRLMIQQMQADVARDPARAQEAIRRTAPVVLRQIEALSRIANDFAHFARMPRRTWADVDVGALVRDVVDLYAGSTEEGVEVRADVASGLASVRWDVEEMRRVLLNLVGNAVQAVRGEGRVTVAASPEARDGRDGVRIEVVDTGTGILPEHQERIFEPDFSTKTSGTGLGLAIVRRALDDMGGSIAVESRPGAGSTFRLWCPVRPDSTRSDAAS